MGRQITHNPFDLCEDEFERVMGLLVSKEFTLHSLAFRLNLSMRIEIDSWSIRGKVSETQSMMAWNYGTSPHISMSLCFNCKDEFYYIQEVLYDLNICKLSEKHLKEIKQKQ